MGFGVFFNCRDRRLCSHMPKSVAGSGTQSQVSRRLFCFFFLRLKKEDTKTIPQSPDGASPLCAKEPLNLVYLCEHKVYFPICRAGGLPPAIVLFGQSRTSVPTMRIISFRHIQITFFHLHRPLLQNVNTGIGKNLSGGGNAFVGGQNGGQIVL